MVPQAASTTVAAGRCSKVTCTVLAARVAGAAGCGSSRQAFAAGAPDTVKAAGTGAAGTGAAAGAAGAESACEAGAVDAARPTCQASCTALAASVLVQQAVGAVARLLQRAQQTH